MENQMLGFAKYAVAILGNFRKEMLPPIPKDAKEWPRKEILVELSKIEKILATLSGLSPDSVSEDIRGIDMLHNRLSIYFDPNNKNSLLFVASDEGNANAYAKEYRLRIPYPEEVSRQRGIQRYSPWGDLVI